MQETIVRLAQRFACQPEIAAKRLDTPSGADGLCVWVTEQFLEFVRVQDPSLSVAAVEVLGHKHDADFWHCLGRVEGLYCDFTLRQIDPASPFPCITNGLAGWAQAKEHPFPYAKEPFNLV